MSDESRVKEISKITLELDEILIVTVDGRCSKEDFIEGAKKLKAVFTDEVRPRILVLMDTVDLKIIKYKKKEEVENER